MTSKATSMKKTLLLPALFLALIAHASIHAQEPSGEDTFYQHADKCLSLMEQLAQKIQVNGVGIIAYIPGDTATTWISKMKVVGAMGNESSNYLAVAYSKAAEMAETFQNSGSGIRDPKLGEFGWMGGLIQKVEGGYILAAFSGATGEQDVEVATAGLKYLTNAY